MKDISISIFIPTISDQCLTDNILLHAGSNEEDFNASLTPTLQEISGHDPRNTVLANTEHNLWLFGRKPDIAFLLITKSHHYQPGYIYGIPAHDDYLEQVCFIWEGKVVPITYKQLGILIDYLLRLCQVREYAAGVVYNETDWYYMEFINNEVVQVVHGKWTDNGSKDFLKSCVEKASKTYIPMLTKTIIQCCDLLNVEMSLNELQVTDSLFLGKGAKGHVFNVISKADGRHLAMKVSIDCDLQNEYLILLGINSNIPNLVVSCPINSIVFFPLNNDNSIYGYGYLMNEIGTKIDFRSFTFTKFAEHMVKLHCAKYYHGDLRKENIIQIINNNEEELRWIDLRESGNGIGYNPITVAADLKYFFKSKYFLLTDQIWEQVFTQDILNKYFQNPSSIIINEIRKLIKSKLADLIDI